MSSRVTLMPHQLEGMRKTEGYPNVAAYWDMGTGKTHLGSEMMYRYSNPVNLVICQKSKVVDWVEHMLQYYDYPVFDLTKKKQFAEFILLALDSKSCVGIINYELAWRREDLELLRGFTMMLDESSILQNSSAKMTKFIVRKLHPKNTILLSGTPCSGKYENLLPQMRLLGWRITKKEYDERYIIYEYIMNWALGFKLPVVKGYKNVDELKEKMREYGCVFLKTEDVMELPPQTDVIHYCKAPSEYKTFIKKRLVTIDGDELIGDTSLTMRLYMREICGVYAKEKMQMFKDIVDSTDDRIIVFYNFTAEMEELRELVSDRPISLVNGGNRDLDAYENHENSVTFVQYQAGARGLNLQKATQMVYFSLPESSDLYEQSRKRIHRIGQEKPCFYHILLCKNSIDEKILDTLRMRKDLTDELFREWVNYGDI